MSFCDLLGGGGEHSFLLPQNRSQEKKNVEDCMTEPEQQTVYSYIVTQNYLHT
jgi:hypothetical protein